ncbi:MAG: LysR family transcriptional regulator [Myxococcota bacterium]
MHRIDSTTLHSLDLNLLLVLHALLDSHSVTEAARQVGRSQSTVSHALARLREVLDDPLFVRSGRRLVPTPRAEALVPIVSEAVSGVTRVFARVQPFDPRVVHREFVVAMPDLAAAVLPRIIDVVRRQAPRVRVRFRLPGPQWVPELQSGSLDLMVGGGIEGESQDLMMQRLGSVRFVVMARQGHPVGTAPLDVAAWVRWPHVQVYAGDGAPNQLERLLADQGVRRTVGPGVPSMLAALYLVSRTDYFFTAPGELAADVADALALRCFDVPMPLPEIPVAAFWAPRNHHDAALRWLRSCVQEGLGPVLRARPTHTA